VIEDKMYSVTPASVKVRAGIVTGEVIEMKVAERIEKGSDRIVTAAKLTGTLRMKNTSANQTVRLLEGKLRYIDAQGQAISSRTRGPNRLSSSPVRHRAARSRAGGDPVAGRGIPRRSPEGEEAEGDPFEFSYIPSPYREETVNFAVSIGAANKPDDLDRSGARVGRRAGGHGDRRESLSDSPFSRLERDPYRDDGGES